MDPSFPHAVIVQLRLENAAGLAIGGGRIELLMLIDELGSLNKAAAALKMSYRQAWGSLKRTEEIIGRSLVAQIGPKRSGIKLTADGKELVRIFTELEANLNSYAKIQADKLLALFL